MCRRKKLDAFGPTLAARPDGEVSVSICRQPKTTFRKAFSLKQQRCPHCGCVETLNRHSQLHGNDPARVDARAVRGQRVFCSNRGRRGGCGRTFSIFLAEVLPRHTFRASFLWHWLIQWLAGASLKAAVEKLRLPFALESVYRLRRQLRRGLDRLRSLLCREQQPPESSQSDPVLQTTEHLRAVFSGADCPPAQFQLHFQLPFLA
jgi:hypothetical protein